MRSGTWRFKNDHWSTPQRKKAEDPWNSPGCNRIDWTRQARLCHPAKTNSHQWSTELNHGALDHEHARLLGLSPESNGEHKWRCWDSAGWLLIRSFAWKGPVLKYTFCRASTRPPLFSASSAATTTWENSDPFRGRKSCKKHHGILNICPFKCWVRSIELKGIACETKWHEEPNPTTALHWSTNLCFVIFYVESVESFFLTFQAFRSFRPMLNVEILGFHRMVFRQQNWELFDSSVSAWNELTCQIGAHGACRKARRQNGTENCVGVLTCFEKKKHHHENT